MNYVNGLQIGRSAFDHARGARLVHKYIYLWLTKVVGWSEQYKVGTNWDSPQSVGTDGATDASNPRRFTSASPSTPFDATMEDQYLLVGPTSPPATTGGFSNPEFNGLYRIRRVFDANTLEIEIFNGVHTDGLPLGETGLNYEIVRMRDNGDAPADNDLFVVRGTGAGGDFDFKSEEDHTQNYSPDRYIVSPFADWSGAAWSRTDRLVPNVNGTNNTHNFDAEIAWLWGFADLTQMVLWIRYYNTGLGTNDSDFVYVGDIVPFHAAQDLRPVTLSTFQLGGSLDEYGAVNNHIQGLSADDTTVVTYNVLYPSLYANNTTAVNGVNARTDRSQHSGRFVRLPLVLASSAVSTEEIRGTLKNLEMGHFNGPRGPIPLGTSRDRIRFFTQFVGKWNGSKIFRYVI